MYALTENNLAIEWPIVNLSYRFPNISFPDPINEDKLPSGIVRLHIGIIPEYDQTAYRAVLNDPILINEKWIRNYEIVKISAEEIEQLKLVLQTQIRDERNKKLIESDWTQLPDSPVDKLAWAQYRQLLRDITLQTDFHLNVMWPNQPT